MVVDFGKEVHVFKNTNSERHLLYTNANETSVLFSWNNTKAKLCWMLSKVVIEVNGIVYALLI